MAEVTWTEQQQQAIAAVGHGKASKILVSAAAGSGKTAVLTERIIEKVKNNADLSRMLIVTFTNAAAGELKARMSAKLTEALEKDPTNKHLSKQISSLSSAHIATIDSFCYEMVKRNYEKLGLPCRMRIAEEAEISLLKTKLMNSLLDDIYSGFIAFDDFSAFTEPFINDRDDSLPDLFISLYNQLSSYESGIESIKTTAEELFTQAEKPFFESTYGQFAHTYLTSFTACYSRPVRHALSYFAEANTKSMLRYKQEFENIALCLQTMQDALERHDFEASKTAALSFSSLSLAGARIGSGPEEQTIKAVRTAFKKDISQIHERFFCHTKEQIAACFRDTAAMLFKLHQMMSIFEKSFTEEKINRGILDYPDIERYALNLLQKDGGPSEFAMTYGACFDEIYIDEYQDINEVQDTIFRMLSTTSHIFMVGDMKQSIYGFRGAAPDIFASYRDRFPLYHADLKQDCFTIFLANNFRCAEPVVRFANCLFSALMNNTYGKAAYLPEDNLVYSKKEEEKITAPVTITLFDQSAKERADITEEEWVAQKVKELIAEGYAPDEIALLFRSPKKSAKPFEEALSALHIPCFSNESSSFFENAEVLLAMCLLNIIDNPRRDIYLAGALQSPIFGLSLEELARIRRFAEPQKPTSLYDAVLLFHENTPQPKLTYFFDWLTNMRSYAQTKPIDKLLWHIYTTTALLSCVYHHNADEAKARRANLMMLYEHARHFEAGSFKGLYNFILYMNQIMQSDATVEEAKAQNDSMPAVKIMSIHASKGLEFKVCFLCACEYTPKSEESRDGILMAKDFGLGLYTPDSTGFAKINGIVRKTVGLKLEANRTEEEMRVLYVALTRAKERLFITASPQSVKTLFEKCQQNASLYSKFTLLSCRNFISLMLTTLLQEPNATDDWTLQIIKQGDTLSSISTEESSGEKEAPPLAPMPDYETCLQILQEKFDYMYPYTALSRLPSKLSVSHLYPGILDEEEEPVPAYFINGPKFLESTTLYTPADRGTATHVFMQFCDFDAVQQTGIDAEIERLIAQKFITTRYGELINRDHLHAFFRSSLFNEMQRAKKLYREIRFNINLPAAAFTEQPEQQAALAKEQVLVQGVIDCFFITPEDTIKIIDYKTDSFTPAQKADPENCVTILRRRHQNQLSYYRTACEKMTGKKVSEIIIYSFDLGQAINL
ncbi:MAG: helicase-exonuclease AddAB subunit AddA [Clostridiales bacterium]|nr:helicase-exonuclease AddAB subunit AddA [Clostridiales bacterium]